jgi:hypothetical protein
MSGIMSEPGFGWIIRIMRKIRERSWQIIGLMVLLSANGEGCG